MALATQCPHCYTSFRVANDQLKLYAGLVRCGTCQQTFNGIDYILAPGETPKAKPVSAEQATIDTAAAETSSKQVTTSSNLVNNPEGVSSIKSTSALPTERLVDAVANTVVDTVAEAEIVEDQLQNQIKNELPDLPQDMVDANLSEQEARKLNPLYSKNFDAVMGYKGKPIVEEVSQAKNYADDIVNGDVEEVESHIDEVVNNHVDDTADSLAHAQEENNKEEKLNTENVEVAIVSDEVTDKVVDQLADKIAAIEVAQLKEILKTGETKAADKFISIVEKDETENANKVIAESAQIFHSILSDDNQSTSSSSDESPLASEVINDDIEADNVDAVVETKVEVEEKNEPFSSQQNKDEINTLASLSLLTSLTTADATADATLEDDIKVELKDTLNDKLNDKVVPTSEEQIIDTDESLLSKDAEHIEVSEMKLDDAAWKSVVAEYTAEQKSVEHTSVLSSIEEKAKTEIDDAEASKATLSQTKLSDIDFEADEDHQSAQQYTSQTNAQEHADQNHPTVTSEENVTESNASEILETSETLETLETTEVLTEEEIEAAKAIEKAKAKSKEKAEARAKAKAKAKVDRLIKEEVEVEVNHNENDDIDDALDVLDDIDEDGEYDPNNNENVDDHHLKPQFVIQAEKKQRYGKWITVFYSSFILLLLVTALGQISYHYRNKIVAHFPASQSYLLSACKLLNCQIKLLTEKGAVTKESQELVLVSSNPQILTLSVQLQNKSNTAQAWPMIELTLMDNRKKTLLQRVFTPQEYLENKKDVDLGISAVSEKNIDINFELSIPKAASYDVKLFYP